MIHSKHMDPDPYPFIHVEHEACDACQRGQHDWCQGDDFTDMTVFRCDCECQQPLGDLAFEDEPWPN